MNSRKWYITSKILSTCPASGFTSSPVFLSLASGTFLSESPFTCCLQILSSGMLKIPFWLRAYSEMQAQKNQKSIFQRGFPGGARGEESTCQCRRCKRRMSCIQINCLIPELGRFVTVGKGNPLPSYCLRNPMERGAWRSTVHRVSTS